jgi:hypothetical protein
MLKISAVNINAFYGIGVLVSVVLYLIYLFLYLFRFKKIWAEICVSSL